MRNGFGRAKLLKDSSKKTACPAAGEKDNIANGQHGENKNTVGIKKRSSTRLSTRRITQAALLIAVALVLSLAERWIPLNFIVPIPGIKLGLANVVTLFAILRIGATDAFLILLVRSLILGSILGPMTFILSFSGGLLAFMAIWLLSHWEGRLFSVIGLSVAGAAAHNIGQVMMASFILSEPLLLLSYLPMLLFTGMITGTLTGAAALPVIKRYSKIHTV